MVHVLFVCLGNICRSPMAEAVFRQQVAQAGLTDKIKIDSAGTGDWHIGNPPHHGTLKILKKYEIDEQGIFARQLASVDFEKYQYIICMDEDNVRNAKTFTQTPYHGELRRLLEYHPEHKTLNVPDPYFTGDFEETYRLVTGACSHLLSHIRTQHEL
jgi:protein-tyrosine phosphatase